MIGLEIGCLSGHYDEKIDRPQSFQNSKLMVGRVLTFPANPADNPAKRTQLP